MRNIRSLYVKDFEAKVENDEIVEFRINAKILSISKPIVRRRSQSNTLMSPDAPAPDSTPHEFIDAEIAVAGLETPADEQALNSALSGFDGIQNLSISGGKIAVEYDPVRITKAQLGEVIARAGYRVGDVESAPASAISDALHEEKP